MPDSPMFKKRRLPFRRTAIPFEARRKPRPRWFIQYKRAFGGAQRHFDEGDWEPCDLVWAEKCVTHVPAPDSKGILTDSELHRLHWQKRCPCFLKDYGDDLHRWCTWKYHFEGVRVRRGVKGEIDGVDDDGLALWAGGIKQAGITDFFQTTARVGLEESGKESSGTPGGTRHCSIRLQPSHPNACKSDPNLWFTRINCFASRQQFSIGERSGESGVLKYCFKLCSSFQVLTMFERPVTGCWPILGRWMADLRCPGWTAARGHHEGHQAESVRTEGGEWLSYELGISGTKIQEGDHEATIRGVGDHPAHRRVRRALAESVCISTRGRP